MESSFESGYKNGTFAALNRGEIHEFRLNVLPFDPLVDDAPLELALDLIVVYRKSWALAHLLDSVS